MTDTHSGLNCGCAAHRHHATAADQDVVREQTATSNVTDLRRARQRARGVMRDLQDAIEAWMAANGVESMLTTDAGARRVNRAITEIASRVLREQLVDWLDERHRITIGRAARAAFDKMLSTTDESVDADDLVGLPEYDRRMDRETLRQVRQIDAGLLYDTELAEDLGLNEPLAEELGDDITRQLRLGRNQNETVDQLADRVEYVLNDAQADGRQAAGVSGQTFRSKAELIAHDSVQDSYNQAARGRYLRNGFRYAVYDATIDTKTTDLCRRMNEHVIDLRDDAFFTPPLHPYCRSGIRPILDIGDRSVLGRDDVADGYLNTIMQTKSYRPPANTAGEFQPTALTRRQGQV